jgi:hypothetical protein
MERHGERGREEIEMRYIWRDRVTERERNAQMDDER